MKNLVIGEKYFVKLYEGRGRPFVGTIVKSLRKESEFVNRHGDLIKVPNDRIVGLYERRKNKRKVSQELVEMKLPKKRGRPRKIVQEEAAPQKKRGRPRKMIA